MENLELTFFDLIWCFYINYRGKTSQSFKIMPIVVIKLKILATHFAKIWMLPKVSNENANNYFVCQCDQLNIPRTKFGALSNADTK